MDYFKHVFHQYFRFEFIELYYRAKDLERVKTGVGASDANIPLFLLRYMLTISDKIIILHTPLCSPHNFDCFYYYYYYNITTIVLFTNRR